MYRTYDLEILMILNQKRPVFHTFRIETDSYEQLEKEAKKKNISINVLLNQIIKEHAFKVNFDKIDFLLTPKDVLKSLFEIIDEKDIIYLGKKIGSHDAIEYMRLLYDDINKNTILQFLDMWSSRFLGYEHKNHGSTHWFSVPHGINAKYSLFLAEFIKSLIDCTIKEPVKIQTSQRTMIFQVAL